MQQNYILRVSKDSSDPHRALSYTRHGHLIIILERKTHGILRVTPLIDNNNINYRLYSTVIEGLITGVTHY